MALGREHPVSGQVNSTGRCGTPQPAMRSRDLSVLPARLGHLGASVWDDPGTPASIRAARTAGVDRALGPSRCDVGQVERVGESRTTGICRSVRAWYPS
jgi:hypothetical protein